MSCNNIGYTVACMNEKLNTMAAFRVKLNAYFTMSQFFFLTILIEKGIKFFDTAKAFFLYTHYYS